MADDLVHDWESRKSSGEGRARLSGFFLGVIKDNKDPQRNGRLRVFIPELGGDASDQGTWYVVGYATPFGGATSIAGTKQGDTTMPGTQKSYGFWAVPPDLDNQVFCFFLNGDPSQGFWFACHYQDFMNHMVPGVAINFSTKEEINKQNLPPVAEYNKNDAKQAAAVWDPKRPVFEPLHNGLIAQGLYTDPERGPATTSARREAPSQVFGLISPRSNTIHIDDDPKNEVIRFRTRSGVQIVMSETTGFIYMISKNGNSWLEISDIGIDMYSKRSISMRAEENINIHADQNVLIHSGGAIHKHGANVTNKSLGQIQHKSDGEHTRKSPRNKDNSNATPQQGGGQPGQNGNGTQSGSPGTGQNGANNGQRTSNADLDQYRGSHVGTNAECVSLSKALGTDQDGNQLGPASGWRAGTQITADNWQGYQGQAVATMNDNGQYSRVGGVSGDATHTGILTGWDSNRNAPVLFDQWSSSRGTADYRTQNTSRYGSFYTIRQ